MAYFYGSCGKRLKRGVGGNVSRDITNLLITQSLGKKYSPLLHPQIQPSAGILDRAVFTSGENIIESFRSEKTGTSFVCERSGTLF